MWKTKQKNSMNDSRQSTVLSHTERENFCDTDSIEAASLWPTRKMGPLNSYAFPG